MNYLKGKVALITGASSGIGLSTARLLSKHGVQVYTAQRREGEHDWIEADFHDPDACTNVISKLSERTNHLDILINNAGIMREGSVKETSVQDWNAQLHMNLTVPFLLIKNSLGLMQSKGAAIVNIGSIEGMGSNPRHPAYCASKAGLHALTRAVAVDHGSEGIRCNAVAPGWINTPLNSDFIGSMPDPEEFEKKIGQIHPLKRCGDPEEVAELIVWLGSEKASFITGQVFTIDGGRTAKLSLP